MHQYKTWHDKRQFLTFNNPSPLAASWNNRRRCHVRKSAHKVRQPDVSCDTAGYQPPAGFSLNRHEPTKPPGRPPPPGPRGVCLQKKRTAGITVKGPSLGDAGPSVDGRTLRVSNLHLRQREELSVSQSGDTPGDDDPDGSSFAIKRTGENCPNIEAFSFAMRDFSPESGEEVG